MTGVVSLQAPPRGFRIGATAALSVAWLLPTVMVVALLLPDRGKKARADADADADASVEVEAEVDAAFLPKTAAL